MAKASSRLRTVGGKERDWSAPELAEFYRVEAVPAEAGQPLHSRRGVTDEGDPWFVLCHADDDDIIIHFARIGGRYVINSPGGTVDGGDLHVLVRNMIERHPLSRYPRNTDAIALQLLEGFAAAVRQGVKEAHAEGLAVPARVDGVAVELRPNGEVAPIDDHASWSPTDWRKSAER